MGPVVKFTLLLLRGYQFLISPLLPHSCRFYPSCSEYACQALTKFGFGKGLLLSCKRIMKCHPFHPGGLDPLP
jgi:putative membrane protein insertion efficiency factor